MSEFIIHAIPGSPFARSVFVALEEKGVGGAKILASCDAAGEGAGGGVCCDCWAETAAPRHNAASAPATPVK